MKKLFSILTTSVLTLPATISIIACNNVTDNKKVTKNEDEEKYQIFKDKVNTFLSTLEFELEGKKDKDMRITDPKSGWNFLIKRSLDTEQSQEKEFAIKTDLTEKIWPDIKHNYENDIVEIITGFAVTKPNIPKDGDLKEKAWIIMPNKDNWSYSTMHFFEGSVDIKNENNKLGGKQTLSWKMGYLKKESYFKSLYKQALTYYFNLLEGNGTKLEPYIVGKEIVFDENWIKKTISDYIDSDIITKNKSDDKLKKILDDLYRRLDIYLTIDNGEGSEVISGTWNPVNLGIQWVNFNVSFTSGEYVIVDFYLKPKN